MLNDMLVGAFEDEYDTAILLTVGIQLTKYIASTVKREATDARRRYTA